MSGMNISPLEPYFPHSEPPGLEVLVLGGTSDNCGLLDDEKAKASGLCVTRESLEGDTAQAVESARPDVLLIDSNKRRNPKETLDVLRDIRRRFRSLKSILVTNESDMEFFVTAVQHGARGIIVRDR